jgi:hypothetical protein
MHASFMHDRGKESPLRKHKAQVDIAVLEYIVLSHQREGTTRTVAEIKGALLISLLKGLAGMGEVTDYAEMTAALEMAMVKKGKGASDPISRARQQFLGGLQFIKSRGLEKEFKGKYDDWDEDAGKIFAKTLVKVHLPVDLKQQVTSWSDFHKEDAKDPVEVHKKVQRRVEEYQRWQVKPVAAGKEPATKEPQLGPGGGRSRGRGADRGAGGSYKTTPAHGANAATYGNRGANSGRTDAPWVPRPIVCDKGHVPGHKWKDCPNYKQLLLHNEVKEVQLVNN